MGALESLTESLLQELKTCIREEIQQNSSPQDCWMNKKQLAEYWGVSESWINKYISQIPHSALKPISFKKSIVDEWRIKGGEEHWRKMNKSL